MESEHVEDASMIFHLLKDPYIIIATGSVWFSTSSMALLEPCLPLWLLKTIHPEVSLSKEYLMIHDNNITPYQSYGSAYSSKLTIFSFLEMAIGDRLFTRQLWLPNR